MWHYGVEIKCLNLRENDMNNSYQKGFIVNKDMQKYFAFLKCGSQTTISSKRLQNVLMILTSFNLKIYIQS